MVNKDAIRAMTGGSHFKDSFNLGEQLPRVSTLGKQWIEDRGS